MQPDDTASPVSLGARGILGARLKSRGARLKIEAAATETGQAKPPAGSRRYEGKGCPPALRLRSGQEGRHEGNPGAKNAALKAAALSATADASGARDDECRGGAASSASPGDQEHRQDCLCHKCENQGARLPPESGGRRRRERRPLQRQAGQNRRLEAGATKAKAARLPFGSAQGRKAATKATPERRMPR